MQVRIVENSNFGQIVHVFLEKRYNRIPNFSKI